MVGIKDVAVAAGVSQGTVSHVLNHPDRVSAKNLAKVLQAMDDLGFVRNESARQLRSGTSSTLGLLLIEGWNPFFNDVTRGIEDEVYADDWSLMVANSALNANRERRNLEAFEQRRVQGILINPTSESTLEHLARMRSRGVSCVLVDRSTDRFEIPSVSVDDIAGGYAAGRHLIDTGRRHILFAGNAEVLSHARDRLTGLENAATDDVRIDRFETAGLDFISGGEVGEHISSLPPGSRPDAIFAASDILAIGALQSLVRHGISVPTDIAIVGYDDIVFSSQAITPLTTVRQPAYEIGRRAAEILLEDIRTNSVSGVEHTVFTPELIVRESTTGSGMIMPPAAKPDCPNCTEPNPRR